MASLNQLKAELDRRERLVALRAELARRETDKPSFAGPDVSDIGGFEAGLIATGRGMTNVGSGILQLANIVTGDDEAFQRRQEIAQSETEAFAPLEEAQPAATFVGEVVGESAALPVGGFGAGLVKRGVTSAVTGATAGGTSELGRGGEGKQGAILGGIFGPIGEGFGKLVTKFGGPVVDNLRNLLKSKGVGNPEKFVTESGVITKDGETLLADLDITPTEFQEVFGNLTDASKLTGQTAEVQERIARAQGFDVPLTQGQATREFDIQSSEDILRSLENVPEGQRVRRFLNDQQEALNIAKQNFVTDLGGELDATRTTRGSNVRATLRDIDEAEKIAVGNLYTEIGQLPGGNDPLNAEILDNLSTSVIREFAPTGRIQNGVRNILEDFEIGGRPDNPSVLAQGPLTFKNAEKMRQRLNKLKPIEPADISVVAQMKKALDDLLLSESQRLPDGTPIKDAAIRARNAAAANFDRFGAKDVVQDLISFRSGTATDKVSDELVLDKILASGNKKITNLKAVKKIFLGSDFKSFVGPWTNRADIPPEIRKQLGNLGAAPKGIQAWKNIQAQGVIDIFAKATTETPDGFFISGAKLNSAMNRVGDEALEVLFDPPTLRELKRLQATIGDATIPVPRTTNPSGTGARLANIIGKIARLPGITGKILEFASAANNSLRDQAQRQMVLRGVEEGATSTLERSRSLLRLASSVGARETAVVGTRAEDNQN